MLLYNIKYVACNRACSLRYHNMYTTDPVVIAVVSSWIVVMLLSICASSHPGFLNLQKNVEALMYVYFESGAIFL